MKVTVQFFSYFKDLTGCERTEEELAANATVGDLVNQLHARFPKLVDMKRSTLIAVGVEYQTAEYQLSDGEEVSFFPPVQGG